MRKAHKFKVNAITATLLATLTTTLVAQESEEKDETTNVEVIEVKGLKGSLSKSINDKRLSKTIKDTINAEDIGKNTDQNIADALGRVTGVSIITRDGEGSQVTVRGAGANQNLITLNGQQLASTDFNQAVDLSSFSADILSKLEVVKTPSADQDEGSLGATINLVTIKPLNQSEDIRTLTVQGRYNDFADEETNYKINFTATETFLDETLGVAISAYDETNYTRRDQYRVGNFQASRTIDLASDENGEIISGVRGIVHTNTVYELLQNTNDRRGATLGLQWLPGDVTEVTFDATYSTQTIARLNDGVLTRFPGTDNFFEGERPLNALRPPAPFTDPQEDWYILNSETLTFDRFLNRFAAGDIYNSQGGDERDNASAQFKLNHELTDTFRFEATLGYSKSESESLPSAFAALQNFRQRPAQLLYDALGNIQPVGYDCTQGRCQIVSGTSELDFGEILVDQTVDGVFTPAFQDNSVNTSFNPLDARSLHLAFIREQDVKVEDEIKTAKLDFDYDLDKFGITTLEFGFKITEREKFVDNQNYTFDTVTATEVFEDEFGNPVAVQGGSLLDVSSNLIAREGGLPYSDFMNSLGIASNPNTRFAPVDATLAASILFDDENTIRTPDNTESRNIGLDTESFYLKANFEFLDGRLSGDVGVRYVKTDVNSSGFGGANFHQFTESLEREFSLTKLRELRDTSLPQCRAQVFADPANPQGYERKYQRSDGLGWDTSSGPDPSQWTRIPDQGPCHDPAYAQWVQDQINGVESDFTINWLTMWQYADVSTTRGGNWDPTLTSAPYIYDGTPTSGNDANQFTVDGVINRNLQSFATTGSHTYENILPSLNLSYIINDDLIGRFAISKTMTRPEIDNLRPGFQLNENGYWGTGLSNNGSRIRLFNPKLDPLESNNLDLSLEWYFAPTSLLSAALFYKDMTNFTETETVLSYLQDIRNNDGQVLTEEDLILPENESAADFGLTGCLPLRATADFGWNASDPNRFTDDLRDLCNQYSVSKIVNGKGAEITGLELGYVQSFDFLGGYILGGLGISANYTYQESEYESDVSSINPAITLPALPVADTPEHTYNFTTFWEQDGHQVRLSYRGSSDSLVGVDYNTGLTGRTWNQGSLWNEGRGALDLSVSYKYNENVLVTFQAVNLLDEAFRTYFTSRELEVQRTFADNDVGYDFIALEEGNPLDGGVTKSRTYTEYKIGTTYRLGVRVNF
ncbi:TonB-dependent receptor [Glaciecola sp. KUL10]|uniref:TonB-dependent receptor n=1 Tax=Glaciecola sp. (strain KUL10) TaxID=2161813 RepID=UPI000D78C619|nr:TonB-dependent receptor [Glaciecola sp. KUL10]GBL05304.1 TonB-dependent receptor [Glaciecola sp. KUL10]